MLSCQRDCGSLGPTAAGSLWKNGDVPQNLVVKQLALTWGRGRRGASEARSAGLAARAETEVACHSAELQFVAHSAPFLRFNYFYLTLTMTLQG